MTKTKALKTAAIALLLAAAAGQALAHHSAAMFERDKQRTIVGVVKEFRWTNPHGYLDVMVKSSKGNIQPWTIEFQSLQGMGRIGLRPTSFKPGETVTLTIHPLKNGTTGGDFITGVLADGKTIGEAKT